MNRFLLSIVCSITVVDKEYARSSVNCFAIAEQVVNQVR